MTDTGSGGSKGYLCGEISGEEFEKGLIVE